MKGTYLSFRHACWQHHLHSGFTKQLGSESPTHLTRVNERIIKLGFNLTALIKPLHERLNHIDNICRLKIALFLLIDMKDLHRVLDNAVQVDGIYCGEERRDECVSSVVGCK